MVVEILSAPPEVLDSVVAEPTRLETLLAEAEDVGWAESVPAEGLALLYLDKAWHGIHFLLTGEIEGGEEPFAYLMAGGRAVDIDYGYEPPRVLDVRTTRRFAEALETISEREFQGRYDGPTLERNKVYPDIWSRSEADVDPLGYLMDHFEALKRFVRTAADRGRGLVVVIG